MDTLVPHLRSIQSRIAVQPANTAAPAVRPGAALTLYWEHCFLFAMPGKRSNPLPFDTLTLSDHRPMIDGFCLGILVSSDVHPFYPV